MRNQAVRAKVMLHVIVARIASAIIVKPAKASVPAGMELLDVLAKALMALVNAAKIASANIAKPVKVLVLAKLGLKEHRVRSEQTAIIPLLKS
jgi:hypothetical protein